MKVSQQSRRRIRLQNILFVVLFLAVIGSLAWLSTRYSYQADWTASGRNTLSDASIELLVRLEGEVEMVMFTTDSGPLKKHVTEVVRRYQQHKRDIRLSFLNPDTEPDKVRELGITMDGELVVRYQGRSENLRQNQLGEQHITNALQRLSRAAERWLVFVEGHGERKPFSQANYDLLLWTQQLQDKGFHVQGLNLAMTGLIPDNTSVLVIASPQVDYLPGEVELIADYVRGGGNLLWLVDPDGWHGLDTLAEQLGLSLEPGTVIDPTTQMYAINNPTFALIGDYGFHALTRDFELLTVFPMAVGLRMEAQDTWQSEDFLLTSATSWSETGVLMGVAEFDVNEDVPGPLSIGIAATREHGSNGDARQQRLVVIGDGDFLSNTYVGNGGNLDLGLNVVNWLSRDDQLLAISAKTAQDTSLDLSQNQLMLIGVGFLLGLPMLLAVAGGVVWWRRRKA